MPRNQKRKPGSRRYRDYTEEQLLAAINDCQSKQVSPIDAAKAYNIPIRTLRNKLNGAHKKKAGRPQAVSDELEQCLVEHLLICAEYGMPLEMNDITNMIKAALDAKGVKVTRFNNNMPGRDWVYGFLSRHKDVVSLRSCQNIKRARGEVKPEDLQKFFKNLEESLKGVPPENILNFDETNLSDDPGQTKCLFKRGVKYPERIMNYSKGNISVMFAGTASGELVPPYVIYKAEHLWESWCERGPANARFGRSKSGWMDMTNFEEWFFSIVVPWARKKEGKKVILGDNLSSHLSERVTQKCRDMNIAFVLLPPNSTDKCQPLDVSFFAPLKKEWRKLMKAFKEKNPTSTSLDKSLFPRMLKQLLDAICAGERAATNLISGFRTCGIYPLDADKVLRKLPQDPATSTSTSKDRSTVSNAVVEYLQRFKYSPQEAGHTTQKRKKVLVSPGKSISAEDLEHRKKSRPSSDKSLSQSIPSDPSLEHEPSTSGACVAPNHPTSTRQRQNQQSDSDSLVESDNDEEWLPPKNNKVFRNIFMDL